MTAKTDHFLEDLSILEALAAEPSLSQRELARRVGLSLTKAHFVLRRLTAKGLVNVRNVAKSQHKLGYLYLLTPKGIAAKAKLTYVFMHRTAADYRKMIERVEANLGAALEAEPPTGKQLRVLVIGDGPLAEVVRDLLRVTARADLVDSPEGAELAIVCDLDALTCAHAQLRRIDLS